MRNTENVYLLSAGMQALSCALFLFLAFQGILPAQEQPKKQNQPRENVYGPLPNSSEDPQPTSASSTTDSEGESGEASKDPGSEFEKNQKKFESKRIDLPGTPTGDESVTSKPDKSSVEVDFVNLAIWTVVVLGGIFLLFYLLKKFLPATRRFFSQPGMKVLSKISLNQNGSIFLVEVGNKILRIGVTSEKITYMGEISDPDEVARVKSQCDGGSGSSRNFSDTLSSVFGGSSDSGSGKNRNKEDRGETPPFDKLNKEISSLHQILDSWKN